MPLHREGIHARPDQRKSATGETREARPTVSVARAAAATATELRRSQKATWKTRPWRRVARHGATSRHREG
jgi:hypothetical protein